MRKSILIVTVVSILALGAIVVGQSAPAPSAQPRNVAVCDIVEVFNKYQKATDLLTSLQQRREKIQGENKKRMDAIEAKRSELEKMAQGGLEPGGTQFEKEFQDLTRMRYDREAWLKFQETLALREHARLTQEMYSEIRGEMETIAKANGIDVVLFREPEHIAASNPQELVNAIEQRKVLYWSPRIDITELVLNRLNKAYAAGQNGN